MKSEMTNDEINRFIHERILNKCWHEDALNKMYWPQAEPSQCTKCEKLEAYHGEETSELWPDYCTDLNAIAGAEKVVIERVGREVFGRAVYDYLCDFSCDAPDWSSRRSRYEWVAGFATLSAGQRARACVAVNEEGVIDAIKREVKGLSSREIESRNTAFANVADRIGSTHPIEFTFFCEGYAAAHKDLKQENVALEEKIADLEERVIVLTQRPPRTDFL